jgi:hypothetical protein
MHEEGGTWSEGAKELATGMTCRGAATTGWGFISSVEGVLSVWRMPTMLSLRFSMISVTLGLTELSGTGDECTEGTDGAEIESGGWEGLENGVSIA